jgi:DNA primase large subunit
MSADEIIKLFGTSPDFDESKTRYQVEHITGKISGTEYTPPECDTMRTYGICIDADSLCKRISHPLSYYSKKTITNKTDKTKKFTQNAAAKAVRKASPP